jgi:apolipoprotein N-acyltransferase
VSPGASSAGRLLVSGGYVIATFLSFPQPVLGRVVDLGLFLSWLSPALLLLSVQGLSPRAAAWRGLWLGVVAHAAVLHWIYVVTVHYGHAHPLAGVAAPLGLAFYPALFAAAFAAGAAWLDRRGPASLFVLAILWAALDHGRSWFLGGFPWATIGYAQHLNPWLLGIASVTGVYGLSFAVALGGAALARLATVGRLGREGICALAVLAALHAVGSQLGGPAPGDGAQAVRVVAVQGNVAQDEKWSPDRFEQTLRDYEQATREGIGQGARLAVWPESAVTAAYEYETGVQQRLESLARTTGSALVFGSVGAGPHPDGGVAYYDSAFVIGSDGEQVARYDKTKLVPFGEYVPLRDVIGWLAGAIARGLSSRDILAGERPVAVSLGLPVGELGTVETVRVGIPICYELIFPDRVRRFVADGAQVLLAITNDAWYGRTGAPYQFLAMTALRSAETGVWTVRAANTGVSAAIDASGRIREGTRIFEHAVLVADVPLRAPGSRHTWYVRFGDVFAGACWIGVGVAFGWIHWRARRVVPEQEG